MSSRTTKLHSAISPSMNDQWSGKTLRRFFLASVGEAEPVVGPGRGGADLGRLLGLGGLLAVGLGDMRDDIVSDHRSRSQKLGPTGSVKSLVAIR